MAGALMLVVLLPALGALLNGLRAMNKPLVHKSRRLTSIIAIASTALSAIVATVFVVMPYASHGSAAPMEFTYYSWIPAGLGHAGNAIADFKADFAFRVDPLSCTMLMIVTWIGFLIHVYATGYMAHEEKGYTRFFTYLNLFMFMMLLLVLGANYVVMFVGWEGVGLCSYLLIGFYYDKNFAADAGKKAFIVNRIGDFGFILGIFLIFNTFGTADYSKVFALVSANGQQYAGVATAICLLLFVGACGKSAQVPLHVWLPDAMAGPTPVSALIHAATMVTAGVYMVVRSNVLFRLSPAAMATVAIIGALTAIFAATIGIAQNDIKKVLAYSTVSQLGYMFLAAGVGAFTAAIFHLMTHAFFKACLFLGAGSVIHGCGGEQDMRKMGGLRKYMPRTHWTMLVATIAISGIPPLAGFFSKDEILAGAFAYAPILWVAGAITAGMTALYMFRLYYMTFRGHYRGAEVVGIEAHGHHAHVHEPHESPFSMTGVLAVLAVLSIVGGFVGLPAALGGQHPTWFQRWLEPVLLPIGGHPFHFHEASLATEWGLMISSVLIALIGIFVARSLYLRRPAVPDLVEAKLGRLYVVLANKYYVDEIYNAVFVR
ncbi:MAG: NADH-quinone oxidoreductase subunit L, partial [Thermoanaerobaculia bacterium]